MSDWTKISKITETLASPGWGNEEWGSSAWGGTVAVLWTKLDKDTADWTKLTKVEDSE